MKNTHQKILYYTGALFLLILSILAVAITLYVMKGNQRYEENTISVSGTAKVFAAPDVAKFSFTVREEAKDPKAAQEKVNEKISKILKGLKKLGIDEKDIKTDSYVVRPKYEWVRVKGEEEIAPDGTIYFPGDDKQRVQVGFEVSQNVQVKLRDLEKVPDALTLFAENGVENLYGPRFEIDDPDALKEKARREAIVKAKKQAEHLASDLGVKLGKIVSFHDTSGGYQPLFRGNMKMMAAAPMAEDLAYTPELPAGENEVSSTVTITYKIK